MPNSALPQCVDSVSTAWGQCGEGVGGKARDRTDQANRTQRTNGEALAARMAKIERGEGEFLTMSQLKERLQR
jgi:hypothetical protein